MQSCTEYFEKMWMSWIIINPEFSTSLTIFLKSLLTLFLHPRYWRWESITVILISWSQWDTWGAQCRVPQCECSQLRWRLVELLLCIMGNSLISRFESSHAEETTVITDNGRKYFIMAQCSWNSSQHWLEMRRWNEWWCFDESTSKKVSALVYVGGWIMCDEVKYLLQLPGHQSK